jgi:serine/threonine protein kinase
MVSDMIGTKLAHFEITSHIGSGGMGEVYKATDTKLGRSVAIKFLPEAFSNDSDRVARFEREARMLASLNHPHIAAIHGLEESGEHKFLVMELVEGPTLAERLASGPIPFEESLKIAAQIADALEAAHERGVVHRDLKPANIKAPPDGPVKVLDLGLATALPGEDRDSTDPSNSPTLTVAGTQMGVILGTAAYMSPEQASGKRVDKRADIWSFGVVLWEMLTNKTLFGNGETISHTLADVLRAEIDFTRLPAATPPHVRELLRRCLDRNVKTRLRDIGEARILLQRPSASSSPTSPRRLQWVWPSAAGVLAIAVIVLGAIMWRTTPRVERPLMNLSVDLGPDAAIAGFVPDYNTATLSPDGTRLVFSSRSGGKQQLSIRTLDQPKAAPLTGTENAQNAFFSPDGESIAFFADGNLKKISVRGGAPIVLCPTANTAAVGGTWGEDGNIILGMIRGGLHRVSENGGTPEPLTQLDTQRGEQTHRFPQILPGGEAVLFTANNKDVDLSEATVDVVSLKTGQRKSLLRGGYYGRYLPQSRTSGYLLYVRSGTMLSGTLYGAPMDLEKLALTGPEVPLLEDVANNPGSGSSKFDVSPSGTLIYLSRKSAVYSIAWLDNAGKTQPLLPTRGQYVTPSLSPDGARLSFGASFIEGDIWIYDWQRDTQQRLTSTPGVNTNPVWTPDGRGIVYRSRSSGGYSLYWIRSDGATDAVKLVESKTDLAPYSFSPDGKRLAYEDQGGDGGGDIWTLPIDWSDPEHPKAGKPELFLRTPELERFPAFSPDGNWLAYAAGDRVNPDIYVRPFPPSPSGGKWKISSDGGTSPVWSPKSRELFFQRITREALGIGGGIMAVNYTTKDATFVPEKPRLWSDHRMSRNTAGKTYDLAPDGKRFAVLEILQEAEQTTDTHVNLLLNFTDELRRRIPMRGK